MTNLTDMSVQTWESKRTAETRQVEEALRNAGFEKVDAYRYNSASIRLRVIDSQFDGLSREKRDALVEPYLEQLPERTQADIMTLFTFTPAEVQQTPEKFKGYFLNAEFEHPSPSML
ncbi:MAG: hypothetical protein JWM11_106 [Planctomycetaceae bacterium]|nr:hypothetical protein [Planctomycetaceae bacterium]